MLDENAQTLQKQTPQYNKYSKHSSIGCFQIQKWIHIHKETNNHFMQNVRPTDSLFRKTYEKKCPQCSRKGMINQATLELRPWLHKLADQQKALAKWEYPFCQLLQHKNCLRHSYTNSIIQRESRMHIWKLEFIMRLYIMQIRNYVMGTPCTQSKHVHY